jgi:hypothetical protein
MGYKEMFSIPASSSLIFLIFQSVFQKRSDELFMVLFQLIAGFVEVLLRPFFLQTESGGLVVCALL